MRAPSGYSVERLPIWLCIQQPGRRFSVATPIRSSSYWQQFRKPRSLREVFRSRRSSSGAIDGNLYRLSHSMLSLPPRVTSPSHWLQGPSYYVRRDPLRWIPGLFKEYGDIYMITSPLGQATMVGSPELARQVLVDRY